LLQASRWRVKSANTIVTLAIGCGKYFVFRLVFFANTPHKHDISVYNYTFYKNAGFWLVNSCDIFFTNSGLALWICRIFTSCRCICIRFNFFSWWRGIYEKYQSRDEKFPEPKGRWNLVSRLVFFGNTPHNMIYMFNYTEYYLEHWSDLKDLTFLPSRASNRQIHSEYFNHCLT
jgi:hypothetical protein